ncbi:P-type DNA transfer protein VirB5 [Xanthomonas hortorum]|uniref:P-type DNA transfer protein VirB5 n=1 Tax=Xanthomonas hortorum TaxID=56454 RepID=UPI0032E8DFD2
MKKLTLSLVAALALSGSAFAGVPVSVVADVPSVLNQIETMAKWKAQYDQMVSQIDQMKKQSEAMTGSRALGKVFNDPALRDYLPKDWQNVYDSVRKGGYDGLSGKAASVYTDNRVFDACKHILGEAHRRACEASAVKPAQDKAFASDAYDAAKSRLNQIDSLMGEINKTDDPKSIAELQGRIASEQALIANEQTKLQLFAMMAQADEKLQEQRQHEINAQQLARRGHLELQAVSFD